MNFGHSWLADTDYTEGSVWWLYSKVRNSTLDRLLGPELSD